jgi:hypothetical protein
MATGNLASVDEVSEVILFTQDTEMLTRIAAAEQKKGDLKLILHIVLSGLLHFVVI